ncbi:ccaat/enhancer binding protein [Anaeramoeba flamelloides]|uniref:Ccaat/enhancer binding protein n=1 Tax=Anaeramoeba flamelloides TaxID=1746091 RepID=A0AAV7ZDM2_9EUKA|nr:ccaat/enhancer binding protein [Anaeramoeba flamelloides]
MSTYSSIPSLDIMLPDFERYGPFESETTLAGETKATETFTEPSEATEAMKTITKKKPQTTTTTTITTNNTPNTAKPSNTRKRKQSNTKASPSEEMKKRKRELNRISARKSRERKKMYILKIEREVEELRQERERLIKLVNSLNQEVERQRKRSDIDLLFNLLQKKFGIDLSHFTSQFKNSCPENHHSLNN